MTTRIFARASSLSNAISYVDFQQTLNTLTQNTLAITTPAHTAGDYLIAYVFTADSGANPSSGNWTAPSGWTQLFSGTKLPNLDIYYRVATGSESSSYTWTLSRSNFYLEGFIVSYRNVAGIGLVGSTNASGSSLTSQTAPGGTINYSKSFILASYINTDDSVGITAPAGFDNVYNQTTGFLGSFIVGGGGGGTLSSDAYALCSKTVSSATISSATATLDPAALGTVESTQIYLLDKNNVTLLSSYSQSFGTVGTNTTLTSSGVTVTSVGADNTVTCPTGVTFDKNGNNTFVSTGTVITGDVLRFRIASTGGTYNVSTNYTVTVGVTKFIVSYDTNNYILFTNSGSFTVPTGVTTMSLMALGAGGGGYGGTTGVSPGAGGAGGGALSYTNSYAVTAGATVTVTVGNGGSGGNGLNLPGAAGGDTFASIGGSNVIVAKGGAGVTSVNGSGAAGGQASAGTGTVKYSGGNGSGTSTIYTNGTSGGGGGGAATPAGGGPTGSFYNSQNTYFTGGQAGQGTNINAGASGSWSTVAAAWTSGYNGGNGQQHGGGGGSCYKYNGTAGNVIGGDGNNGFFVAVWGGRTFSSGTTF